MASPLHSAATMAQAIANDPSLVGVPRSAPLYESLNAQSTPTQIAEAYNQFTAGAGGDTTVKKDAARTFLESRGVAAPVIEQSYNQFLQPAAPLTIEDLYQQYAGRGSDPDGLAYWQQQFGDTIDPNEIGIFQSAVAEARAQGTEPAVQAALAGPPTPPGFVSPPPPNFEQMVRDAYGSIGRTGIGDAASNIDQAGFDNFVNALRSGSIATQDFDATFKGAVADYLVANPDDQYSTYVTNFLQQNNAPEIAGIQQLYQDILGRDADPSGLGTFYKQFGPEISPEERALFEQSARPELESRVQGLYKDFLGRDADVDGLQYHLDKFGSDITDEEREQFRQAAAVELTGTFGGEAPDDVKLLEGFKRVNDLGISEDVLRRTLGEDAYNAYQNQLTNFATTNIQDILADNQLTFDESQRVYNFARDLGFNSEDLARITGQDQSLFDLIDTNYRTSRDQIVKTSLEAPTVESDADRVLTALALQDQFGFSDEDLSEATGLKLEDLRLSLDPVRNFQSEFSSLVGSTDTTTAQLKDFLSQATGNEAISKMYGDSLGQVGARLQELETKWSPYKTDALQAENLFNQLSGQRDALGGQYYRGVFGDLEKSAALLVNKGLDTLNDLGQKDKFQTATATQDANGKFGRMEVADGNDEAGYSYRFVPLTAEERATLNEDGTYQKKIGTVVIDKDTGNELTGLDGNLLYQRSGGRLKSKKHYLTAQFTPEGVPILTASEQKSGIYKFVSDVGPMIVSIAAMVPGPHQPFAMAANAALALEQKNYIGAVLSGLGAYGTYTGQQLASLTAAQKAGTVTDAAATASQIKDLSGTLSNIKLAQTAVAGVNALATNNLPGLINAGLSAYGQTGGKLPSGVTTAVQAGNLAVAIDRGDVAGAMYALGDLTESKDFKIAGAAKNLVDAFETGDPARIASAGLAFSRIVGSSDGSQAPTGDKRADADVTQQLADAGLEEGDQFARDAADMTEADIAAIVAEGGFGNVGAGELTAGPSGVTTKTVESMPEMSPRTGETAGEVRRVEPEPGFVVYERDMTYTKPDGTIGNYTITYDPEAREGMQLDYGSVSNIDYDNDLQLDQDGVNKILRTRPEIKAIDESFSSDDIDFDFDPFIGGDTIKEPVDTPPLDLTKISVPKIINASAVLPGLNISGSLKIVSITPDGLALAVDESGETSVVNNADGSLGVGDTVVADTDSDGDSSGRDDGSVGGSANAGADQGGEDGGTGDSLGSGEGTKDGAGTGDGNGTDDGKGDGAGTGDGASVGDGDGSGTGDGAGDGDVTGDGDGDGTGDGKGSGDGDGAGKPAETPKVTTPKVTPPRMTPAQVARILNVPVSSPIVQDVIEALYGTMEYLDIGAEFETSKRKAKPAATQKQLQQTKMAQGGYIDDLLAENMSVDELLNLLR